MINYKKKKVFDKFCFTEKQTLYSKPFKMTHEMKDYIKEYCERHRVKLYTLRKMQRINKKSTKVQTLGSGTFGQCGRYKGKGFDLVVKVFLGDERRCLREMITEMKLLRNVRRLPGFQRMVGLCLDPPFLVSKYGGNILRNYVQKKKIDVEFLRQVIIQVGTCIQEMARDGLQHNDIKDNNVCVKESRRRGLKVTLIDFGLAEKIGEVLYQYNPPQEDASWMAPEVSYGGEITESSDTYSLAHLCLGFIKSTGLKVPHYIKQHLKDSLHTDPEKRPKIQDLIDRLQSKTNATKRSLECTDESQAKKSKKY